jgi:Triose-phosphate Transporter family
VSTLVCSNAVLLSERCADADATLHRSYLQYVLPVGVLFSIVLWLSNAVYLYLSVSFIQMLKASMPVAVYVVGIALRTTQYSHRTAINMAWIGFGIALASYGEINFVLVGVIFQVISIFCESFRLTLIQVRHNTGSGASAGCTATP